MAQIADALIAECIGPDGTPAAYCLLDKFAAAIHAERARHQWQPMETAPKDGSYALLNDGGAVVVAYWHEDKWESGWVYANLTVNDEDAYVEAPTHWMPLPEPPRAIERCGPLCAAKETR